MTSTDSAGNASRTLTQSPLNRRTRPSPERQNGSGGGRVAAGGRAEVAVARPAGLVTEVAAAVAAAGALMAEVAAEVGGCRGGRG